ncbi:MAG: thioesterase family protein [Gammaproteobacteria bacterium]|nr:thioesterase family protein [Gammaproteobacteria bacterium]
MLQTELDLSGALVLEPHGADTYVGESPDYPWGRIYGGLVVAQALRAAQLTVREEHPIHSLHAYFILGGDLSEPVRYEVNRLRNGRSFTTRQVIARQSGGAILVLSASFQVMEDGPETQSVQIPSGIVHPTDTTNLDWYWAAGVQRCDVALARAEPRSLAWCRYPVKLDDDPAIQACALAYVSDVNPMSAVSASHPQGSATERDKKEAFVRASLDHAMWFHRPVKADDWMLLDMRGHGMIRTRGLATGPIFAADGAHVATVAQEGLMRLRTR